MMGGALQNFITSAGSTVMSVVFFLMSEQLQHSFLNYAEYKS